MALAEDPAGSGYYLGFGCGAIDPSGDYDWWKFEARAGDRVAVAVDPEGEAAIRT